jgi:hypothetical protein
MVYIIKNKTPRKECSTRSGTWRHDQGCVGDLGAGFIDQRQGWLIITLRGGRCRIQFQLFLSA